MGGTLSNSTDDDVRSGTFDGRVPVNYKAMIDRLQEGDLDWTQSGGLIAVRCFEDPRSYRIVVAKIVHETEDFEVRT